jgi:hypothetical protein
MITMTMHTTSVADASKFYSGAQLGAWKKGYAAFASGEACPYLGIGRKNSGFRRGFRNAWQDGFNAARRAAMMSGGAA